MRPTQSRKRTLRQGNCPVLQRMKRRRKYWRASRPPFNIAKGILTKTGSAKTSAHTMLLNISPVGVTRLATKDTRGIIKFTLPQTSKSNLIISTIYNGDELLGKGALPFLVVDKSGINLAAAGQAWISNTPQIVFSRGIQNYIWTLKCIGLRIFLGGN